MIKISLMAVVLKRVLMAIPMMVILASVVFLITNVLPGDPARVLVGPTAPEWYVLEVRKDLGLERPVYVQYFDFMTRLLQFDLGNSFMTKRAVAAEILERFPTTVELTVAAMSIGTFFGIILGVFSAYKQGKVEDHIIRFASILLYCSPIYILGGLAQFIFGVRFGISPISGRLSGSITIQSITGLYTLDAVLTGNLTALIDALSHLFLPALVLSAFIVSTMCRISRANIVDELQKDYILMASATGLPQRVILLKHAFRNALLPVITMGGLLFALLLGGAVLTESVFSLPGVGRLLVIAAESRDLPLIRGIIVFYAVIITFVSCFIDLIYYVIDPRISRGER